MMLGFPCGSAGKESTCNAGDLGSIPGLGRSPGEGKGYPLQYSGLENSMDYTFHWFTKSQTWLSGFHFISLHFMVLQNDEAKFSKILKGNIHKMKRTPVFLPGKFYGQKSLAECSPLGHKDLDTTEWLSTSTNHGILPRNSRLRTLFRWHSRVSQSLINQLHQNFLRYQ